MKYDFKKAKTLIEAETTLEIARLQRIAEKEEILLGGVQW